MWTMPSLLFGMEKAFENIGLKEIGVALLDLAMPRRCVVCGEKLMLRERFICLECLSDLPLTHYWQLSHNPMADKFNARIQEDLDRAFEDNATVTSEPYAYATALFFYNSESGYKKICQHLKYHAGIASGRYFAAKLGRFLARSELYRDVDVVIPVPLHWTRRRSRGYNQAEIIARELAAALGASLRTDVLVRARRTRTQTRMSVASKADNVSGAFAVRNHCLEAHHVLLVDDTFTTGSTLDACRCALRRDLPASVRISVATLAFVVV